MTRSPLGIGEYDLGTRYAAFGFHRYHSLTRMTFDRGFNCFACVHRIQILLPRVTVRREVETFFCLFIHDSFILEIFVQSFTENQEIVLVSRDTVRS